MCWMSLLGCKSKIGGHVVEPGQNGGGCPRIPEAEQPMLAVGREGSQGLFS
jgi:hypothetical protein